MATSRYVAASRYGYVPLRLLHVMATSRLMATSRYNGYFQCLYGTKNEQRIIFKKYFCQAALPKQN